jgi:hypothetical protein
VSVGAWALLGRSDDGSGAGERLEDLGIACGVDVAVLVVTVVVGQQPPRLLHAQVHPGDHRALGEGSKVQDEPSDRRCQVYSLAGPAMRTAMIEPWGR